jgi:hypothetical protein
MTDDLVESDSCDHWMTRWNWSRVTKLHQFKSNVSILFIYRDQRWSNVQYRYKVRPFWGIVPVPSRTQWTEMCSTAFLMICWEQCSIAYLLQTTGSRTEYTIFIWLQKQVNDIILIRKQRWNQPNAQRQFCNVKRKGHRQSSPFYSPSFSIQPDWNRPIDSHFGQSKTLECSRCFGKSDVSIENVATASSKQPPSLRQEFFQS